MIQANEVRVGNRFIRELHTHNRGLDYDKDFVLDEDNMGMLFVDIRLALNDLFPIPLTEQILISSGFKKFSHEPGYTLGDDDEKSERCDEYSLGKLSIMDWGNGFILSNSNSFDLRIELKSLHQLQNLYFALTGKELKVESQNQS